MTDTTKTAEHAAAQCRRVAEQIAKVYIGPQSTVDMLLVALFSRGHVLLEGVPGIAKTTLVRAFSETLGCTFKRIQFTPDLLPADITGTYILNLKTNTFELRQGPLFGQIVLGDEINRAPARTQSALLEAMQEGQVTIDGHTERLSPPFMVLATQNPVEHEGVYMLPEAQLDRFLFRLDLTYPTYSEERDLLRTYNKPLRELECILKPQDILAISEAAEGVFVDEELMDYIVQLVTYTREHPKVMLGASPRATLALMRSAKVHAFVQGRNYVLPDDVRHLSPYVLTHRIVMTPEAELEGVTSAAVVSWAVQSTNYTGKAQAS